MFWNESSNKKAATEAAFLGEDEYGNNINRGKLSEAGYESRV